MIIACRNQINGILKFHSNWDALNTLATKSSLIITAEGEHAAISGEYDRMNTAACHFVHSLIVERVGNNLLLLLVLPVFISFIVVDGELFQVGQAEWSPCVCVCTRYPKLI